MLMKPSSCSGCQLSCAPYGSQYGWVPADGDCTKGVLMVLEAAGADEAAEGRPVVGKAGHYLFQQLARVGIERDFFRIHNVLSCQPPGNKLAKMPFEQAVINHCAPNLDRTIEETRAIAKRQGQHFTILTLGRTAFKRIMGYDDRHPAMREDYLGYPHWSPDYQAWVIAADHPSYLMRGNNHLVPVLQFAATRAVEIATHGLTEEVHHYIEDPNPQTFAQWVADYRKHLASNPNETFLSYDIETPMKQGSNEEDVAREDDEDYTILRCSFAYIPGEAVSIPWTATYMGSVEEIFATDGQKIGWNSDQYDDPRIRAQVPINGVTLDGMLAWHVLNSTLPKGLGFVTPFYNQSTLMWKHLSSAQPAFYNAKDADMALRNFLGIRADLMKNNLWQVFDRHVIKLNKALGYMSSKGVLRDEQMRLDSEHKLQGLLDETDVQIKSVVPTAALKLKVYKKPPKDITGLIAVPATVDMKLCPNCAAEAKAAHFKSIGKKRLKLGEPENDCLGKKAVKRPVNSMLWAKPLDFKISKVGLEGYQRVMGHKPIITREGKVSFDDNALKLLLKKHPSDPLYPLVGEFRGIQKLLSTYIGVTQPTGRIRGGMPIGRDGRIHTTFSHNPSTLRLAAQNPNLQNLPRPSKDKAALENIIRNLIVAADGHTFLARDFSGIEAVLVGYEAKSPEYIRLAKRDVHTFYTMYSLYGQGDPRVKGDDLPLLSWDDDKLFAHLEHFKGLLKEERNNLYKHLTHAINFGQGAKGAQEKILKETNILQPLTTITKVMDIYKEIFPAIGKWQGEVRHQADRDGHLRNAFGYIHRFSRVFAWKKEHGQWIKEPGDDAQKVLAFKPQSTAAGIIKEAILRLYFDRFEEAGQYLRLQVHDEVFNEVPDDLVDTVDAVMQEEMERPIPELAMPASWNMGPCLAIGTEAKKGKRWGQMK